MKRNIFKRIKKIILFCTVFITCFVVSIFPTYAATVDLQDLINNGSLQVEGTSFGIPGVHGSSSGTVVFNTLSVLDLINNYENIEYTNTNFYQNAKQISDRLVFTSYPNSVLLKKGSSFEGVIYGLSINWIVDVNGNLGFIWLNSDVSIDLYLHLRSKGTNKYTNVKVEDFFYSSENGGYLSFKCPYVPIDCDSFIIALLYNTNDSDLIDVRSKMPLSHFIQQGKVVSHQFQIIDFKIDLSATVPPLSEQPIYSKPQGSDTISSVDKVESELIDSTNSSASQQQDKMFDMFFDRIDSFSVSISAFRNAFNYFVDSHPVITFICVTTLITGIILLFSSFSINRGGKG